VHDLEHRLALLDDPHLVPRHHLQIRRIVLQLGDPLLQDHVLALRLSDLLFGFRQLGLQLLQLGKPRQKDDEQNDKNDKKPQILQGLFPKAADLKARP